PKGGHDGSSRRDGASIVGFFFQAEDGIRDFHVTGVQTCALPILGEHRGPNVCRAKRSDLSRGGDVGSSARPGAARRRPRAGPAQIGRASCRETGLVSVEGICVSKISIRTLVANDIAYAERQEMT